MEQQDLFEQYERPVHTNTFAIPKDKDLLLAYKVHKPAIESLIFKSEKGRQIFAEAFIENDNLGTLADLCLRELSRTYGTKVLSLLPKDPIQERNTYDSINIDSPLESIYEIEDFKFWKRLVLAKTNDPTVKMQKDSFNWRNLGISLKYVELVEECPAEFWPEAKMEDLALKIKDFVKEMHIHKLQSMQDYNFKRYLLRDSDTDKSDTTDVSSSTDNETQANAWVADNEEGEEEGLEEQENEQNVGDSGKIGSERSSLADSQETDFRKEGMGDMGRLFKYQNDVFEMRRNAEKEEVTARRKQERRERRAAQLARRERREEKRLLRKLKEEIPKPKVIKVKGVFDLPIDVPVDDEYKKVDRRNLKAQLNSFKNYDYPPKHCRHIDLRFVRLFDKLVEFSIEFNPPPLMHKYHKRHFKFAYEDVYRLAMGIRELENLRIFRLRDSRMDEPKLRILTSVLKHINVEVVDFGFDQLQDDCDDAIYDLFQGNTTIKSLELEGNSFKLNVMQRLSQALSRYSGTLKYLGLSRNPLNYEALHCLCRILPFTEQVHHLCLAGVQLPLDAIICCIANELLRRHRVLRKLDLVGMSLGVVAGEEIIRALGENQFIEDIDCRGCDLPYDIELEIEMCKFRNRYICENPYIGDETQTEEDIEAFLAQQRNPIIVKAESTIEKKKECLELRPDVAERFSNLSIASGAVRKYSESTETIPILGEGKTLPEGEGEAGTELEKVEKMEPFIYNPNEFNLQQFHTHIALPGPSQRYFYFRAKKLHQTCARDD